VSNDVKAERPMFVLLVAGLGFFALSFVAMGVFPWLTIDKIQAPDTMTNPYKDEAGDPTAVARGRDVYIAEGCWHCHSQFVRPVANEEFRYGPRSQAWEAMFDIPHLYGTRRIGPDLSRESGRRSDDWHLAHLWNPRSTVPGSLMPKYTWLFEEKDGKWQPTERATDLVAYLQNLGVYFRQDVRMQVWPSRVTVSGSPQPTDLQRQRGEQLFAHYCSGCHGPTGDGKGLAVDFLVPSASSLTTRYLPREEVFRILFMGSEGSAMPSFAELTEKDLWAISLFVHELGKQNRKPALEFAASVSARERGADLYGKHCVTCHGKDGIVLPTLENLKPSPKHFRDRLYDPGYLVSVIRKGRPGTAMAPYGHLSDREISDLATYVSSLFDASLYKEE